MNLLEQLADPRGAGAPIAFSAFLLASLVAVVWVPRIFRAPIGRPLRRQVLYHACVLVVFLSLFLMTFYLPQAELEWPATSEHYRSLSDLTMWIGHLSAVAAFMLLGFTLALWVNRRDSPWHWPCMWLMATQAVLGTYAAQAMYDHMDRYYFWSHKPAQSLEIKGWERPWLLGAALVFALLAAVNYYLARRVIRGVIIDEMMARYIETRFAATSPDPSRPRRRAHLPRSRYQWWLTLRGLLHMVTPFKLYICRDVVLARADRAPQQSAAANWTWLDWFVMGMAAFYGVTPPYTVVPPPEQNSSSADGAETK